MSSVETQHGLTVEDQEALLHVAERALESGLTTDKLPQLDVGEYSPGIQRMGASFVTLRARGLLRGCVGSLEPHTHLVTDVWCNAFRSAFYDPRFTPLTREEFDELTITVSVLDPRESIQARSEMEAIRQLSPHVHGVIVRHGSHVATFLPSVWSLVDDAHEFMQQLLVKAGLPPNDWPDDICMQRYTVQKFQLVRAHVKQPILSVSRSSV